MRLDYIGRSENQKKEETEFDCGRGYGGRVTDRTSLWASELEGGVSYRGEGEVVSG